MNNNEHRPLLASDHKRLGSVRFPEERSFISKCRHNTKRYLTVSSTPSRQNHDTNTDFQSQSKYGHYSVLGLVSLDISSIFADLILQLLICEGRVPAKDGNKASDALGIVSLVFSCLFMVCSSNVVFFVLPLPY